MFRKKIRALAAQALKPLVASEPVEAAPEEPATYNLEEMLNLLMQEGRALAEAMSGWVPEDSLLDEVLADLPATEKDFESAEISDLLLNIQRKYIVKRFLGPFMKRLHSFSEDVAALSEEDRFYHYLHTSVITSQLVQMMAVATTALIANAYLHKNRKKQEEQGEQPKAEVTETNEAPTGWMQWGMKTGEA
jgi:hypothetical protein